MEDIATRQKIVMTEEEFFAFIQEEINKYRQHAEFEAKADISFDDLQSKLTEYTPLSFSLTQLQARYRYQSRAIKRAFDRWFDAKTVDVQTRFNRIDVAKTKWLSATEVERLARVENAEEYQQKLEELDSIKAREEFITALIKDWDKHNYILSQMCANIRAEVSSLSMEGRL